MFNSGNRNYRSSFEILKGSNPRIILLEEVVCDNKFDLLSKEKEHINNLQDYCVNKTTPLSDKSVIKYCEYCDCNLSSQSMSKHKKSKKHLKNINN